MISDNERNDYLTTNENNRYNISERDYPYKIERNMLTYSNNDINNNNNYYKYSRNVNFTNNNLNNTNDRYSYNTIMTEKGEEKIHKISKSKTIEAMSNRYFSKVIVENIRQQKDILYTLDNYLNENKYKINYEYNNNEKNEMSFLFYDENIAFNFTKLLNNMKKNNPLYAEMKVHLSLKPNNKYNKYNKLKDRIIKKRGLSIDSIQRLFNGYGAKKQDRKIKINQNLDLGVSSPFLYPYEKKREKKLKNSIENIYANSKLKDYNRLPIRVLDIAYKPFHSPIFREEVKDKWISPSNFKI